MSTLPEQFSAARTSQLEAQLSYFHDFTAKAVESAQQLMHLNIDTVRASLEKQASAMSQLMLAKDPRDLFALTTQSQQSFEGLMSYTRALFGIATGAQGALPRPAAPTAAPAVPAAPAAPAPKVQVQAELLAPADNVVAAPEPVAQTAPLPLEAKPVAKAVNKVPAKPVAASFPAPAKTRVTGIKAIEAPPPPVPVSGKPDLEAKAAQSKSKSRKKK